jgi:hypothetical protein
LAPAGFLSKARRQLCGKSLYQAGSVFKEPQGELVIRVKLPAVCASMNESF